MAERYWKELRPSDAGRFRRLDLSIRHDRDTAGRDRRRPRQPAQPKLRTTAR